MSTRITASLTIALIALGGCDREPAQPQSAGQPASVPTPPAAQDDHSAMDQGHDHDKSFEVADLGVVTLAGFTYTVTQTSALKPGEEVDITLTQAAGNGDPWAIRLWVGIESAQGSVKTRTHRHGAKIEAHIEVPDPLPAGAQLWIEVETDAGKMQAPVALR
jgi:hypothetical protein